MQKKKGSRLFRVLLSTLLALLLLVFFLPSLLSSTWGNKVLLWSANCFIEETLDAESIDLSWSGKQLLTKVTFVDKEGKQVFAATKISTDWNPIASFFSSKSAFGVTEFISPEVVLNLKADSIPEDKTSSSREKSKRANSSRERSNRAKRAPALRKKPFQVPFSMDVIVKEGKITIESSITKAIYFENIEVKVSTKHKENSIAFDLAGNTLYLGRSGSFHCDAIWLSPLEKHKDTALLPQGEIKASCDIKHLPMEGLDRLFSYSQENPQNIFQNLIGDTLDTHLTFSSKDDDANFDFSISSSQLKGTIQAKNTEGVFALTQPGKISLNLTKAAFNSLAPSSPFVLAKDTALVLNLDRFEGPQSEIHSIESLVEAFALQANLNIPSFILSEKENPSSSFTSKDLSLVINGENLQMLSTQLETRVLGYNKAISDHFGSEFKVELEALAKLYPVPAFEKSDLNIRSDKFSVTAKSSINEQGVLSLLEPLNVIYVLSPELLAKQNIKDMPKLIEPISLRFSLESDPFSIYKTPWDHLELLNIKGRAGIDKTAFYSPYTESFELKEIELDFLINNPANNAQIIINSELFKENLQEPLNIKGKVTLTNYLSSSEINLDKARGFIYLNLPDLPTYLVGSYFNQGELTELLFGKTLQVDFQTSLKQLGKNEGSISLKASSNTLDASFECKLGKYLDLHKAPAYIRWRLSPQAFTKLYKLRKLPSDAELLEDAEIEMLFDELQIPLDWGKKNLSDFLKYEDLKAKALLKLPMLAIGDNKKGKDALLEKLQAELNTQELSSSLELAVQSQTHLRNRDGSDSISGVFSIKGHIDDLMKTEPFSLNSLNASLQSKLKHFPTEALSPLHFIAPEVENFLASALGPEVNAEVNLELEKGGGPLKIHVTSSHANTTIDGHFDKGILSLNHDAKANLRMTKEVIESLGRVNPFIRDIVSVSKPISLVISEKDTKIPLLNWDSKLFSLGLSEVQVGKVLFSSKGEFKPLFELLNSRPERTKVEAWFSPIRFEAKQGILQCLRTDALLDQKIHLLSWGDIDFNKEHVEMTLAVTGDTIRRTLGGSQIPNDYTLQIAFEGNFGNVKGDWGSAIAQLSTLKLRSKVNNTLGAILGGVLDTVGPIDKKKVPPAPPIPWTDKDIRGAKQAQSPQSDTHFQKDIHQSIESLFDLFEKKKK